MSRLCSDVLNELPADVEVPRYSRKLLKPAIVHLGLGNFHRSHQAVYLDDLFQQGAAEGWGIAGVGLLPQDERITGALKPQDYLYTLLERDSEREHLRVIGSLCDYQHAPSEPQAVLARLSAADTRIVSLTVTESGYYWDQSNDVLQADHPNLRHDLEHSEQAPVSLYGYLCAALQQRRLSGLAPFTVLSCDNLPGNGDLVQRMLSQFAQLFDPQLAAWIEDNVTFPNCMVDRITPATTTQLCAETQQKLGLEDAWPVLGETFRQWVIEDHFCAGRPEFEKAGVQFTNNVAPYELMKLRMLNGSHQALCHLGMLLGYQTTDEALRDPLIVAFLNRYLDTVRPLIPEPASENLADYQKTLLRRFANTAVKDQLARICFDASARIPKFVLPSAQDQLARGEPVAVFAFVVACWIRRLGGKDESGQPIDIQDPLRDLLLSKVRYGETDPTTLLNEPILFNPELVQSQPFVTAVQQILDKLYNKGTRLTLVEFLGQ